MPYSIDARGAKQLQIGGASASKARPPGPRSAVWSFTGWQCGIDLVRKEHP